MKHKKTLWKIAAVSLCLLVIVLGLVFLNTWEWQDSTDELPAADAENEFWNGSLETILFMGLDKYQAPEDVAGYFNDQQSDFMMVLIIDRDSKTCDLLHLNRDTMTEIQRLGIGGGVAGTFTGQLALAHTYGSGGSDSCINAKHAVSELLGGVCIDHYVTVTMDAVSILNDMAGGVTLEIMDDFSEINPDLVQGTTVTLTGEQALQYIRSRSGLQDSTNLHRMERQRQYVSQLLKNIQEKSKEDANFLEQAVGEISPYMQTDYSIYQLTELGDELKDFSLNPIVSIPGEAIKGAGFMEFYPDQDALKEIVEELFHTQQD